MASASSVDHKDNVTDHINYDITKKNMRVEQLDYIFQLWQELRNWLSGQQ